MDGLSPAFKPDIVLGRCPESYGNEGYREEEEEEEVEEKEERDI